MKSGPEPFRIRPQAMPTCSSFPPGGFRSLEQPQAGMRTACISASWITQDLDYVLVIRRNLIEVGIARTKWRSPNFSPGPQHGSDKKVRNQFPLLHAIRR